MKIDESSFIDKTPSKWVVGWAKQQEDDQLLQLFSLAFNQEMSLKKWRWKYSNVVTRGAVIYEQGKAISFYGGVPRQILILGNKYTSAQICDVMVAPRYRRILTRRGAFIQAAIAFSDRFVGEKKEYVCTYGFPSERHYRLGEHLGLYGRTGEMLVARWDTLPFRPSVRYSMRFFEESDIDLVDSLWRKMAGELTEKVVLCRDKDYIFRRFLRHPDIKYLLLIVRSRVSGFPIGLLVLRDHGSDGMELLDIVAAPSRLPMLIEVARRFAGKLGHRQVFWWVSNAVSEILPETNPRLDKLNIPLGTTIWNQSTNYLFTRDLWWLTGGDTDFR